MGPNGSKWSKTCYIDHLGPFGTILDHIRTLASLPFWTPGTLWVPGNGKKGVLLNSPMYEEGFGALGASFMHKCGHSNEKSDRKG